MIGIDPAVPGSGATISISTDGKTWHQVVPIAPMDWAQMRSVYPQVPRPRVDMQGSTAGKRVTLPVFRSSDRER